MRKTFLSIIALWLTISAFAEQKDSTTFRYDREQNELVIQAFFDPHDAPEDVDNHIRCLVDFEIPELIQKGGKT